MVIKNKKVISWLLMLAVVFSMFSGMLQNTAVYAQDTQLKVVLVGNLQDELGHSSEWDPAAETTAMTNLGNGFYSFTGTLPAGNYEYKIALGSWAENYGAGGVRDGANIGLALEAETEVTFYYNHNTHKIADSTWYTPIETSRLPRVVGNLQQVIGDVSNWAPDKANAIMYDDNFDGVYSVTVSIPKGNYEYKITLGSTWEENYGLNGQRDGANIPLNVKYDTEITFFYNSETHEIYTDYNPIGTDGLVDKSALYHNSRDSLYRSPFGAITAGTEVALRLRTKYGDLSRAKLYVTNNTTGSLKTYTMQKAGYTEDGKYDIWEAKFIPETKGVYGYKFVAGDGPASAEYGDDDGLNGTGTSFDEGAKEFQLTVYDPNYKTPDWMKAAIVYQIFPDRFFNGNLNNDNAKQYARGYEPIEHKQWNEIPDNPRKNDQPGYDGDGIWSNDFFGGDIEGIRQKLDYLQEMGVNTIYLNPIAKAASNHKYDATDYKELDPMFGTLEEFQAFTQELKERGMHLIIDGVFNHVGDDSVYFDRYGKYPTVGAYEYWSRVYDKMNAHSSLTEEQAKAQVEQELIAEGQKFSAEGWHNWFNIENNKVPSQEYYKYQAWWGFDSLPEFKSLMPEEKIGWQEAKVNYASELNNKALADYIMYADDSVSKTWLKRGASGWRLDVANEVDTEFWREFRKELKDSGFVSEIGTDPVILGEIWDDASKYFLGDQYDSVMNYRFRGAVLNFLKNGNAEQYMNELEAIREDYPQEAFYALMNLVGSHDTERALFILGGDAPAETANSPSEMAIQRLKLAAVFQMGYPGAPTIYYGDEAGLTGSKDPDCRRPYPWGSENADLLAHYKKVGKIRENNKVLQSGDVIPVYAKGNVMAIARKLGDSAAIVVVNRGDTDENIDANVAGYLRDGVTFIDVLSGEPTEYTSSDGVVNITVPKMSGRILITKEGQDLTPPEKITGLTVKNVGDKTVSIEWNAVPGTKYNIYRTTFSGGDYVLLNDHPITAATYTDTTANNATIYYYAVAAVDDAGNESEKVETGQVIPYKEIGWVGNLDVDNLIPDETVIGAVYQLDDVTAEIWVEGITDGTGAGEGIIARLCVKHENDADWTWYEAEYKGDRGNNDVYGASFIPMLTGVFTYKIEFSSDLGTNWRSTEEKQISVKPSSDLIPPPPAVLAQPEQESSRVTLNWTVADDVYTVQDAVYHVDVEDVYGFEIYRDGKLLDRIWDSEVRTYTDYDVENGTTYTYTVVSFDDSFNRAEGNTVTVTPDLVMIDVTFKLHAPDYTPLGDTITIPGSFPDTQWNTNSHEMTRGGAVTPDYTFTIKLKAGTEVYYKYVRNNSWDREGLALHRGETEDVSYYGYGAPGTDLHIIVQNQGGNKMVVEDEVVRWIDMPVVIYNNPDGTIVNTDTIMLRGSVIKDPVLIINGEQVTNIEYNANNKQYEFSHEVKLNYGKNTINIHVEPNEQSKSNIFKGDSGAIGKATKDYTIVVTTTAGKLPSSSGGSSSSGSSGNIFSNAPDDNDVNQMIDNLDDTLNSDDASDILDQIGDKDISSEMAEKALTKVLEKLEDVNDKAAQAIAKVLNKVGQIDSVKAETKDGKKVVKVEEKDLETALEKFEKAINNVIENIKAKGNENAVAKVKENAAVTISVKDAVSNEALEVFVSAEFIKKLRGKGIGIQVAASDGVVKLPAAAISAEFMNGAKEVRIKKELVKPEAAKEIKDNATAKDSALKPIGAVYNFEVSVIDSKGMDKKVDRFNAKAKVEIKMDSNDLASIKDKRKAGAYYVAEDGSIEFKGGKFSDTGVEFETDHFSSYVVMEYNKTFQDIQAHWAKDYIEVLAARHITKGIDGINFNPSGKVTRAQFATFLGRALGLEEAAYNNTFSDVSRDAYYTGYVLTMKKAGLINGYEDGTFRPDAEITREQMVTMIMRAYAYVTGEDLTSVKGYSSATFADINEVSGYAVNSLKAAKALGLANGVGGNKFNPSGSAERAAVAKMIIELLEKTNRF
ncbi:alpha-amylase family glycosyl hydrolase [Petroclostridium xylanilyticum]|uniref:alpha-amylase family glycosyl hydrolase n=1 Tax=Petroclostridium xylanilyticum TaxID=1792311 RepID=UPI000B983284|nr:alpha-amylase family glycosyl hydrolase [Petroclostridium xylanilyticum]